jgi:hypothetical protein
MEHFVAVSKCEKNVKNIWRKNKTEGKQQAATILYLDPITSKVSF